MCRVVFTVSVKGKRQRLPGSPAPRSLFQSASCSCLLLHSHNSPQVSVWPAMPFTIKARTGNCLLKKMSKSGYVREEVTTQAGGRTVPPASCRAEIQNLASAVQGALASNISFPCRCTCAHACAFGGQRAMLGVCLSLSTCVL